MVLSQTPLAFYSLVLVWRSDEFKARELYTVSQKRRHQNLDRIFTK